MKDGIYTKEYIILKKGNCFYEWHFDLGWVIHDLEEDLENLREQGWDE